MLLPGGGKFHFFLFLLQKKKSRSSCLFYLIFDFIQSIAEVSHYKRKMLYQLKTFQKIM